MAGRVIVRHVQIQFHQGPLGRLFQTDAREHLEILTGHGHRLTLPRRSRLAETPVGPLPAPRLGQFLEQIREVDPFETTRRGKVRRAETAHARLAEMAGPIGRWLDILPGGMTA